jgi:osmotically inducible protein OsmC
MKTNKAKAKWTGTLKDGKGMMTVNTSKEDFPYTFSSRFEDGKGSNPEELIAAAHAGCFSMAFSGLLEKKGYKPISITTTAEVKLGKEEGGFKITESHLNTEAEIEGIDDDAFEKLAMEAKANCLVSQALSSLQIKLSTRLNIISDN